MKKYDEVLEMYRKKGAREKCSKIYGKTPVLESFFNKVSGLQLY